MQGGPLREERERERDKIDRRAMALVRWEGSKRDEPSLKFREWRNLENRAGLDNTKYGRIFNIILIRIIRNTWSSQV